MKLLAMPATFAEIRLTRLAQIENGQWANHPLPSLLKMVKFVEVGGSDWVPIFSDCCYTAKPDNTEPDISSHFQAKMSNSAKVRGSNACPHQCCIIIDQYTLSSLCQEAGRGGGGKNIFFRLALNVACTVQPLKCD